VVKIYLWMDTKLYFTHIAAFSAKNQKNLFITNELLTISEPQKFV